MTATDEQVQSSNKGKVVLVAGNGNTALAEEIKKAYAKRHPNGSSTLDCVVKKFMDGEISVSINDPVRGADVFIIQSTCKSAYTDANGNAVVNDVNDNLMELLVLIDACHRSSARRITAVIPYFGYARQDRRAKSRDPITAKLVANMIVAAGANRVLTMDLHADQIQGFFDIPLDHLNASKLLSAHYIKTLKNIEQYVVVSPDVGSVKRARNFSERLGAGLAIVDKRREVANKSEVMHIIGDVKERNVILFDDMVDTGGSLCNAANALKDKGAEKIYACASHGVLSGSAISLIEASPIEILRLADTIPYPADAPKSKKIQYVSCAEQFADAIASIHEEKSIFSIAE
ncbi:MAG: ribose-phosphate pyrophosphokinase [Oscillospiraceae bacterium]|jgi:ribose-phosphate pyrophosphokinase|nr:ribose-phosphate pyrophosphokinase [Oscillospiraceae bacterium]